MFLSWFWSVPAQAFIVAGKIVLSVRKRMGKNQRYKNVSIWTTNKINVNIIHFRIAAIHCTLSYNHKWMGRCTRTTDVSRKISWYGMRVNLDYFLETKWKRISRNIPSPSISTAHASPSPLWLVSIWAGLCTYGQLSQRSPTSSLS